MSERHPISPPKNAPDPKRHAGVDSNRLARSDTVVSKAACVRPFDLVPLDSFNGLQLPTKGDILRRFFHLQDLSSKSNQKREFAKQILTEVSPIYAKIPCSMKSEKYCLVIICKLFEQYQQKQFVKSQYQSFKQQLSQLCDLTGPNSDIEIRNDRLRSEYQKNDDLAFLKDQKTTRNMYFSSSDNKYNSKYHARHSRLEREQQRLDGFENEPTQSSILQPFGLGTESSKSSATDQDYIPPTRMSDKAKSNQKNLVKDPRVLSVLDRTNISSRSAVSVLGATAAALGEDIDEFTLNRYEHD